MAENQTLNINGTDLPLGNIPGFTFDKNDPKFVKIDDLVNKEEEESTEETLTPVFLMDSLPLLKQHVLE